MVLSTTMAASCAHLYIHTSVHNPSNAADDNPVRFRALTSAPIFEAVRKTYWDNVAAHARGRPANHVSIVGDERSCMTWFLYPDSAPIGTDPPVVRFVKVPAKEATTVMELGRALGEHPRTRFVVVVDTLDMQTANDASSQLSDVLTGRWVVKSFCWGCTRVGEQRPVI